MRLSSLAYGVVCIKKRLAYITNDVLTSRYEYRFDIFALDLDRPRSLANCKLYFRLCSKHPPKRHFAPKYCSVVNVLTIDLGTIAVNVNYVLRLVQQV